jgi:BCCT family betaine/carnitine transporter
LFSNNISLSFSMGPFNPAQAADTGIWARIQVFHRWWPLFHWFWSIALMPITTLFIARVSRGRTIREVALGTMPWASPGCFRILSVLGGYPLYLQYAGEMDVAAILAGNGPGTTAAMAPFLLPWAKPLGPIYFIMAMVCLATTLDSASYALASIRTFETTGAQRPDRPLRLTWAMVLGIFDMGLLVTSGEAAGRQGPPRPARWSRGCRS